MILLIAFIFAGVKAFTEPNSDVAATINSGLTTAAGGGSNDSAKSGLSPDMLTKFVDEIAAICGAIMAKAGAQIETAKKRFEKLKGDLED